MSVDKNFFLQDLTMLHVQLFNLKKEQEELVLKNNKKKSISKLVQKSSKKIKPEAEPGVEIINNESSIGMDSSVESGSVGLAQEPSYFVSPGDSDFNYYKDWKSVDHEAYLNLLKTLDSLAQSLVLHGQVASTKNEHSIFASTTNEVFENIYLESKRLSQKMGIEKAWASDLLRLSVSIDNDVLLKNLIDDNYWVTKEAGGLFCRQMVSGKYLVDKKVKPYSSHLNGLKNELEIEGKNSSGYSSLFSEDKSYDSGWVEALINYKIDYENGYYLMRVSQDSDSRQVCGSLLNLMIFNYSKKCLQLLNKNEKLANLCLQDNSTNYESLVLSPEIQSLINSDKKVESVPVGVAESSENIDKKEQSFVEKQMDNLEKKLPYFYSKTIIGMMRAVDPVALVYSDLLCARNSSELFGLVNSFFEKNEILRGAHKSQKQAIACNAVEVYMDFSSRGLPEQAVEFLIKNEIFDLTKVSPKLLTNLAENLVSDLLSKEVPQGIVSLSKWLNNEQVVNGLLKNGIDLNKLFYESFVNPLRKAKILKMSVEHTFLSNFEEQVGKGKKTTFGYNFDSLENLSKERLNLIGFSKEQFLEIANEIDSYLVSMDPSSFDVVKNGRALSNWSVGAAPVVLNEKVQEVLSALRVKVMSLGGGNVSPQKALRI